MITFHSKFFNMLVNFFKSWSPFNSTQVGKLLFCISMILCLIFITDGNYTFSIDGTDHLWLTLQVVEKHSISSTQYHNGAAYYNGRYYSGRAPGYSFLAIPFYILFNFFGGTIKFTMKFVSALCFSITTLLIFKLGKMIYDKRIGVIGSFLFMFGTFAFEYAIKIWTHTASTLFVILTIYCIFRFRSCGKLRYLFFSAISNGLVFAMRYADVIVILPVVLYLLMSEKENRFKAFMKNLSLYLLILVLSISPVLFYHWIAFDNPFATGYLYHGYGIEEQGLDALHPENLPYSLWNMFFFYRHIDDYTYNIVYHSSLIESSPFFILSIFGFLYSFQKKKMETFAFITTVGVFSVYYGMIHFWWGVFCFNMRFLSPLVPIFCLTSAFVISKLLKELNVQFIIGGVLTILPLSLLIIIFSEQFYFVFFDSLNYYEKVFSRVPINQINFGIGMILLLSYTCYFLLNVKNHQKKYISLIRGLVLGVFFLSTIFSAILNIYLNIMLYTYKNGRVLPFLDAMGKLFGISVPGYFFYHSVTAVPLLYYINFSMFFIYALILLFDYF